MQPSSFTTALDLFEKFLDEKGIDSVKCASWPSDAR